MDSRTVSYDWMGGVGECDERTGPRVTKGPFADPLDTLQRSFPLQSSRSPTPVPNRYWGVGRCSGPRKGIVCPDPVVEDHRSGPGS